MPVKPKSHSQLQRDADPARMGRRLYDDSYRRARNDRTANPHEAHAEEIRRSPRWRRLRLVVLGRQPLCVECLKHGVTRAATDVDHIEPLVEWLARGEWQGAYDERNLQPLCRSDHNRKTAAETRARAGAR